jgi:hypothetical protein
MSSRCLLLSFLFFFMRRRIMTACSSSASASPRLGVKIEFPRLSTLVESLGVHHFFEGIHEKIYIYIYIYIYIEVFLWMFLLLSPGRLLDGPSG